MKKFYIVTSNMNDVPLRDHLLHGYESHDDFARSIRRLIGRWDGRIGECIGEKHGFLLLRFHDTPGGSPDEEWLPRYLLKPSENPGNRKDDEQKQGNDDKNEIENAFGFE